MWLSNDDMFDLQQHVRYQLTVLKIYETYVLFKIFINKLIRTISQNSHDAKQRIFLYKPFLTQKGL